jgi:hypothetical protein
MSKYLIVNADDFNTDSERNIGIIKSAREGIVRSTSVISNMPWNQYELSELTATFRNSIGIHLNLTKGLPLTKGLMTVVNAQGQFLEREKIWRRAVLCRLDLNEIEIEFTAQINKLQEAGISPSHIDGNNHIHVFPGISGVVARVAKRFGICKIRLPFERFCPVRELMSKGLFKKLFIGVLSLCAKSVFIRHDLLFTDYFAGIHHPCVSRIESVRNFLKNLSDGTTELMCHPGFVAVSSNPFSNEDRIKELSVLTHPSVLRDIKELNINLISYSDINK